MAAAVSAQGSCVRTWSIKSQSLLKAETIVVSLIGEQ